MEKQSRIAWIDEFKGLVLLLVCVAHVDQHFKNVYLWSEQLVCLRMAAFFFISGVLFSSRRFSNFKDYFLHKSKVLLLPYVTLSFLFLLLDPVVYNFDIYTQAQQIKVAYQHVDVGSVGRYLVLCMENIFVEGMSVPCAGPLWFVYNLYFISLAFFLVQGFAGWTSRKIEKHGIFVKHMVIGVIAILCIVAGFIFAVNKVHIPLGIERICTTLFYFSAGFLCKKPIKNLNGLTASKWKWILPLIAVVSFVGYALVKDPSPWVGLYNNKISLLFVGSSFLGILGLIAILSFVSNFRNAFAQGLLGVLRNISRNGLIVLAVHFWSLMILKTLFKPTLDQPGVAYVVFPVVILVTIGTIPLFRNKLYFLIGKEKVSVRESLSLK